MQNNETLSVLDNCRQLSAAPRNVHQFLNQGAPCELERLDGPDLRRAKQTLAACIPHAVVRGGRASHNVVAFHRRVQLDIDAAHNPQLDGRLSEYGAYFARLNCCELVGRSASGRGLCVWVRTSDPWNRDLAERVIEYIETRAERDGMPVQCDRVNSVSAVALRFSLREVYTYRPDADALCV